MKLQVAVEQGLAANGRAIYRPSDFALVYAQTDARIDANRRRDVGGPSGCQTRLVIADTLVLTFSAEGLEFRSLDAYVNRALWKQSPRIPRDIAGTGRLFLAGSMKSITDRIDLMETPDYSFDERSATLRVGLSDDNSDTKYYALSDCLVVGVRDGCLTSMYLSPLEIE